MADVYTARPLIGEPIARWVIGPQFVDAIARRTLRRVKALAEQGIGARDAEAVA